METMDAMYIRTCMKDLLVALYFCTKFGIFCQNYVCKFTYTYITAMCEKERENAGWMHVLYIYGSIF